MFKFIIGNEASEFELEEDILVVLSNEDSCFCLFKGDQFSDSILAQSISVFESEVINSWLVFSSDLFYLFPNNEDSSLSCEIITTLSELSSL